MQNTSTTYSLFENTAQKDCLYIVPSSADTTVLVPLKQFAPRILLNKPHNIAGSLIFTIIFLIVFAVIRLRGKNLLSLLLTVILKKKKYGLVLNEGIIQNILYYILGIFLSFSSLAIGISHFIPEPFNWKTVASLFLFLIGWHLYFLLIIRICSFVFNCKTAGEEAIINLWAFHIMTGLLISPFVLSVFFVKTFAVNLLIKTTAICLILFYVVKFIRWVEILFTYRVSIFYMILYLCTLEVIPLLTAYKLML